MVRGFLFLALDSDPRFELPDGFALRRQFDVGVYGVNVFARRMPHEGFPYIGHDAGFHETGVEGVAKIVEAEGTNPGAEDGRLPGGFDSVEGTTLKGENQAVGLRVRREQINESHGKRDLASLTLGGFRVRH